MRCLTDFSPAPETHVARARYQYAFLDSGTGGLPYFAELHARVAGASCVYVADTAHFPYGEKKRDEVIAFASDTVSRIIERFSPEVIVVACNTMSVAALPSLRARFSVPFVGTVPAIKLAASLSVTRKIGLLATERTVCDPYVDSLAAEFAGDCDLVRIGDSVLVSRVERELLTAPRRVRLDAVRPSVERFRAAGADAIVLACTHFLHVRDEIAEVAGPEIAVIDSLNGVVQRALSLVPPRPGVEVPALYVTDDLTPTANDRYRTYAGLFGMEWRGRV